MYIPFSNRRFAASELLNTGPLRPALPEFPGIHPTLFSEPDPQPSILCVHLFLLSAAGSCVGAAGELPLCRFTLASGIRLGICQRQKVCCRLWTDGTLCGTVRFQHEFLTLK